MAYIYETLTTNQISRALYRDSNASWHEDLEACDALAEWIKELACDTNEPIELDIVSIRCDWSLYDSIENYNENYDTDYKDIEELDTSYIELNNGRFLAIDE